MTESDPDRAGPDVRSPDPWVRWAARAPGWGLAAHTLVGLSAALLFFALAVAIAVSDTTRGDWREVALTWVAVANVVAIVNLLATYWLRHFVSRRHGWLPPARRTDWRADWVQRQVGSIAAVGLVYMFVGSRETPTWAKVLTGVTVLGAVAIEVHRRRIIARAPKLPPLPP